MTTLSEKSTAAFERRFCVAPMMDWTDRHCRVFHRQYSKAAWLYTEMVTTGALLHGDVARHLDFDSCEHPVALQLGGSEPEDLASCARLAQRWGYRELNLNCGCPSERVQRGAFGACLMREPELVADCVRAMRDACDLPVTVKHRIGIDDREDYGFVRDFVGQVGEAGCTTFIVHARNAILKGLSPKENREIPPLRYKVVYDLKKDFPQFVFIINGGLTTINDCQRELSHVDGVMLGRTAYHHPEVLGLVDQRFYESKLPSVSSHQAVRAMMPYIDKQLQLGVPLRAITRHMLGAFNGYQGARRYRQMLSDATLLKNNGVALLAQALACVPEAA